MKLNADSLTIVLAGSFNPAILSPQWIATKILGIPEGQEFRVEMLTPVAGIGGMPRFSFENLSYSPNFQLVTFHVGSQEPDGRQKSSATASRILSELPHTPVSGIGFNFGFIVDEPQPRLLGLLTSSAEVAEAFPGGCEVVGRAWTNVFNWQDALVNLQCELRGTAVSISMNFHHDVKSAAAAAEVLGKDDAYSRHFDAALAVAKAMSQQDLEET